MLAALFLTYRGKMLNEQEILKNGSPVGGLEAYCKGNTVIEYSGGLYPFHGESMLNPLDPVNLILSWPILGSYIDGDSDFESILETMLAVTDFRKKKFSVMTRYKSGAARTIKLEDGSDKIVILGDFAKARKLSLPILSTQLSDQYRQDGIEIWKSLGFRTPPHYGISVSEQTYGVDGWNGSRLLDGTDDVTYYNIIGGGRKVTVKKVHREANVQEVSDDMGSDWDYSYVDLVRYSIEVKPFSESLNAQYRKTTPNYVWEDKNAEE